MYDDDGTFGSNLWRVIGMSADDAHTAVGALVREALRPMADEISIVDVQHVHIGSDGLPLSGHEGAQYGIQIQVTYQITGGNEGVVASNDVSQLVISVPLFTGGEE